MNKEKPKSEPRGIEFLDVRLTKSSYEGISPLTELESQGLEVKIGTESKLDNEKGDLLVYLGVEVKVSDELQGEDPDVMLASIYVEMEGVFKFDPASELTLEYFRNVNAPAIMYPFIREHVATLSRLAKLKLILLPPFNFVNIYQASKKSES